MNKRQRIDRLIGGALFIAGTTIGAGMVALPITTGTGGFWPATLLIGGVFIYMLVNVFLLLEANFYCENSNINIIGMSKQLIGPQGEWVAWLAFLLLLYAASAAYIEGCSELIASVLANQWSLKLGLTPTALIFTTSIGTIAYLGIRWMDAFNRLLMTGLIIAYILSVTAILPQIQWQHFAGGNPMTLIAAVPVVVLSFTAHIVLPSLRSYLHDDIALIRRSVILGMGIPFLLYILWEGALVGLLPYTGSGSITEIANSPTPLGTLTHILATNPSTVTAATSNAFFSFFAMLTTLVGCILALSDFLSDGLGIPKNAKGRLLLILGSLLPPLVFALLYPAGFIVALSYAGVAVAILYGILPAWMVWRSRYILGLTSPYRFGGNKVLLIGMISASICVIILEILSTEGWLKLG